jgi:hypothetical protein
MQADFKGWWVFRPLHSIQGLVGGDGLVFSNVQVLFVSIARWIFSPMSLDVQGADLNLFPGLPRHPRKE